MSRGSSTPRPASSRAVASIIDLTAGSGRYSISQAGCLGGAASVAALRVTRPSRTASPRARRRVERAPRIVDGPTPRDVSARIAVSTSPGDSRASGMPPSSGIQ